MTLPLALSLSIERTTFHLNFTQNSGDKMRKKQRKRLRWWREEMRWRDSLCGENIPEGYLAYAPWETDRKKVSKASFIRAEIKPRVLLYRYKESLILRRPFWFEMFSTETRNRVPYKDVATRIEINESLETILVHLQGCNEG